MTNQICESDGKQLRSTCIYQVCVQLPTSAVSVALPAFVAAGRPARGSSLSYPTGAQLETRRTLLQRSTDGTEMEKPTDTDPASHRILRGLMVYKVTFGSLASPSHLGQLTGNISRCYCHTAFSALTLLVGWQEGHLACKN